MRLKLEAGEHAQITGLTRTGKSTFAKQCCAEWMKAGHRVICFDVDDEYSVHGVERPGLVRLGPLLERVELQELLEDPDLEEELLSDPELSLSVVPRDETPEDTAEDFNAFLDFARTWAGPGLIVVCEEMGWWAQHAQSRVSALFCRMRKYGLTAVGVAQRAVHVPLSARSQVTHLVTFHQHQPPDIEALADQVDDDFAERVKALPAGEHLYRRLMTVPEGTKRKAGRR